MRFKHILSLSLLSLSSVLHATEAPSTPKDPTLLKKSEYLTELYLSIFSTDYTPAPYPTEFLSQVHQFAEHCRGLSPDASISKDDCNTVLFNLALSPENLNAHFTYLDVDTYQKLDPQAIGQLNEARTNAYLHIAHSLATSQADLQSIKDKFLSICANLPINANPDYALCDSLFNDYITSKEFVSLYQFLRNNPTFTVDTLIEAGNAALKEEL